jgi:DNA replication licensing factor MCM4
MQASAGTRRSSSPGAFSLSPHVLRGSQKRVKKGGADGISYLLDNCRSDVGSPTPRRNRRGDIHSGLPPTPSGHRSPGRVNGNLNDLPTSSAASRRSRQGFGGGAGGGGDPSSSAAGPLADGEDDEEDAITVVWGTTVTIQSSMSAFKWFLESFRASDRQTYDLARYEAATDVEPSTGAVEWAYTKERPEKRMYQYYLERMRETGQTNLNLDVIDLLAFRHQEADRDGARSKKDKEYAQLYHNLQNYPQEIIPILDQVLKDCALDWAWNNLGGASQRAENTQRAEQMEGAVFKVRPIGGTRKVNMRELNPQGKSAWLVGGGRRGSSRVVSRSQISTRSFASKVSSFARPPSFPT